jgi:thiol:disulfide interchange protein DsbC
LSQGKVAAEDVSRTPIPGLFQVISDGEIFYVDSSGRYSVVGGSLIDMQQQRDLTAAELDRLHAIAFDRLPLQLAIKEVRGKGTRSLAVFEDPNCPICKVFTKFLDQIDDVTIYRFMYPVIAPQSEAMAQGAWCARDRAAAWRDVMAGVGVQAYRASSASAANAANPAACDTSGLAAILKFGEANRINNTPTVILGSGKRLVGATPPELFMQELEQGGRRPR